MKKSLLWASAFLFGCLFALPAHAEPIRTKSYGGAFFFSEVDAVIELDDPETPYKVETVLQRYGVTRLGWIAGSYVVAQAAYLGLTNQPMPVGPMEAMALVGVGTAGKMGQEFVIGPSLNRNDPPIQLQWRDGKMADRLNQLLRWRPELTEKDSGMNFHLRRVVLKARFINPGAGSVPGTNYMAVDSVEIEGSYYSSDPAFPSQRLKLDAVDFAYRCGGILSALGQLLF